MLTAAMDERVAKLFHAVTEGISVSPHICICPPGVGCAPRGVDPSQYVLSASYNPFQTTIVAPRPSPIHAVAPPPYPAVLPAAVRGGRTFPRRHLYLRRQRGRRLHAVGQDLLLPRHAAARLAGQGRH